MRVIGAMCFVLSMVSLLAAYGFAQVDGWEPWSDSRRMVMWAMLLMMLGWRLWSV